MSTISHPPSAADRSHWSARVFVTEMWASLAIFAMWLAVAVSAVWGPTSCRATAAERIRRRSHRRSRYPCSRLSGRGRSQSTASDVALTTPADAR